MPWFDGRGPGGMGPMTGRGRGPCGGRGFSWRRPRGPGPGFGACQFPFWRQTAEPSDKEKINYLEEESKALKEELKEVQGELDRLRKG